ncbi:hypothetical protein E2C01_089447 [Portunus trituberculatus]|uniref:Uncharacterized protein n=1 Tax=Portunus trituberculatus TaxID=210409 RepID=A0A5B7JI78_PORTR|nr:hypothetical protein [Portunus trituberculatus]
MFSRDGGRGTQTPPPTPPPLPSPPSLGPPLPSAKATKLAGSKGRRNLFAMKLFRITSLITTITTNTTITITTIATITNLYFLPQFSPFSFSFASVVFFPQRLLSGAGVTIRTRR